MTLRIPLAAATAIALTLTLAACAPVPEPEPTPTPTASASAPAAAPAPEATSEEVDPTPDLTCETIIAPSTVQRLTDLGWSHEAREMRIGADVIEGGIQCVWGDYSVASDHVQIYGFAYIDQDTAAAAQQTLLAEGWKRVDTDGRTYITEDPSFAIATDDDGFGTTYEFGDGWVALADTKQSLLLIERSN